jgi:hypothetical protein
VYYCAFVLLVVFSSANCGPLFKEIEVSKEQTLKITSDPPSATITVSDENGSRIVGATPTSFSTPYSVTERKANLGNCAAAVFTAGADAIPEVDKDDPDAAKAVAGFIGLLAIGSSASAGVEYCKSQEGIIHVEEVPLSIQASLNGYLPAEVEVTIPKEKSEIHFELVPHPGSRPDLLGKPVKHIGTLVVFEMFSDDSDLDYDARKEMADLLAQEIKKHNIFTKVARENTYSWSVIDQDGQPIDCMESGVDCKPQIIKKLEAGYGLVTMVIEIDDICIMTATQFDGKTFNPLKVVRVESKCDMQSMEESLIQLADKLAQPQKTKHQGDVSLQSEVR